jgi:hypothetical protein
LLLARGVCTAANKNMPTFPLPCLDGHGHASLGTHALFLAPSYTARIRPRIAHTGLAEGQIPPAQAKATK